MGSTHGDIRRKMGIKDHKPEDNNMIAPLSGDQAFRKIEDCLAEIGGEQEEAERSGGDQILVANYQKKGRRARQNELFPQLQQESLQAFQQLFHH